MRNILYACLIAVAVAACTTEKPKNYVTLSGTIVDPNSDSLMIYGQSIAFQKKINVNEEGVFQDTLKITAGNYTLFDGTEQTSLYLKNGYDVRISLDTKQFDETLTYEGVGAAPNNYLVKKLLLQEDFWKDKELFKSSLEDFQKQLKTFTDGLSEGLSNTTPNMDSAFVAQQKEQIGEMKNGVISQYVRKNLWSSDSVILDLEQPDFITKLDAYIADFTSSLDSDVEGAADAALKVDDEAWEKVKSSLLNEFEYKKFLTTSKGTPSPTFTGYANFAGGTTSLNDFKGKYVYIDVWATWCGPCKAEAPYLKAVEEEYRDKNIVFVGVSVDSEKDFDKWKAMVEDKELVNTTQLFASESWKSPFIKNYKIQGIPRFMLIDPEGNIVSANAPRPSSDELKTLLGSLNI